MTFEPIDRTHKPAALDVICEAFYDYPVMRYAIAESGDDYNHHLREVIGLFCENRFGREQSRCAPVRCPYRQDRAESPKRPRG